MIRHIRWQILLVVMGIGLLVGLLVYVALNFTTEWVAGSGGTYVEGLAGVPRYLNPLLCQTQDVDGDLCSLLFNGLTRIDQHGQVMPELADRWEVSADGLVYTFYLRPDIRWHDGVSVTAADVVFTIGLIQDPGFPGQPDLGELWRSVDVTAIDAKTVRFELGEPFAAFLDYTTVGILPRHLLKDVPAAALTTHPFNLNPIGTGIFKFSEIVTDTSGIAHVILDSNPFFYDRKPLISRIQFRFFPSDQRVYQAYLDDEVQGIGHVALQDVDQVKTNPDLQVFTSVLPRFSVIYLNLASDTAPFFGDPEVRQALLYALDRQALIDTVLDGQGTVSHSPVLPGSWAYDENIPVYDYDPAKSAALLEEIGWRATGANTAAEMTDTTVVSPTINAWFKEGRSLSFSLLVPDDPSRIAIAEKIVHQWGLVGIRAKIERVAVGLLSERLAPRHFQAALVELDLTSAGDPDPYPFWHQTQIEPPGQNYAGYDDRHMSEILELARRTPDQEARKQLYHEFQQLFATDVPAILLYHPTYTYALDRYVYGANVGPIVRPGDRFLGIADWFVRWRRVIRSEASAERTMSVSP